MKRTEPQPRFVVCANNKDYPASVELRKLYQVVVDEAAAKHHQLHVIDESSEDYLYPEEYFVPVQLLVSRLRVAILLMPNLTNDQSLFKAHFTTRVKHYFPNGKGHAAFATWPLFMPATTYSPTHFRVQYNRPCGA